MPATVIAERVGWTGSISWFRERVRAIRPEYLPADPVDRLEHPPGRVIQCDLWFPAPKIPVGFGQEAMLPVLVMVAAFSRFIAAVMLPSRQTMDLVAGMWQLLSQSFAAVPHELWTDYVARHIIGLLCPTMFCGRSRLIFSGASPARSDRAHNEMARRHDCFLFLSAERKLSPCWRTIS